MLISLGVDTYEKDPISFFKLKSDDFFDIGKKIAYRNKYGFAQPVWKNININKGLKMREELESSNFFSNDNFTKSSKELFIKESQSINQRHLWMAYCAIQSSKYLKELKLKNVSVSRRKRRASVLSLGIKVFNNLEIS